MKTKLHPRIGFHTASPGGNPTGIGEKYVRRLHAAGIPVAITCADGDVGIADALIDPQPGDELIFRVVKDGSERFAVPDYEATPQEAAAKYWDLIKPLIHNTVDDHKDKIWVAYGNELNRSNAQWIFKWSLETVKLMNSSGYKGVGPNWASGNPGEDNQPPDEVWRTPEALDFLRYCAENPDKAAVGIHEYSLDENDLFDGGGTKVGRFRNIVKVCQENQIARPPILIKEFGYGAKKVPSPEQIVADLRKLFEKYPDYPPATLWYLGPGYDNIADLLQPAIGDVAEFVAGLEVEVDLAEPIRRKPMDAAGLAADDMPEPDEVELRLYEPPARVTIDAQPRLNLRREPVIDPDNIVARMPDGSICPVVGVARENFDPQSNKLWVQIEFTDPAGQKVIGFCSSDFIAPDPDPLPVTLTVAPEDGLRLRSSPILDPAVNNKIVTMEAGSIVRVLGGAWENFDPQIRKWWFYVEFDGQRGYARARFLVASS